MTMPTVYQLSLPLLLFASDGNEHHIREAIDTLATQLQIRPAQLEELLPNSNKLRFVDRVQWANTYLKKAGLLQSAGWGKFKITDRGFQVLRSNPSEITRQYLMQFPEFVEFKNPNLKASGIEKASNDTGISEQTPEELIQNVHNDLNQKLADELLEIVLSASPAFFEQLVIDLLLAMGYGGALGMGQSIGRSGDGGLDGYIYEDKLGLNTIYVQAKRYAVDNVIGRPALQGFAGSLMGERANKGVFITTSSFSRQALDYANSVPNVKIIPIDGQRLTQLMIEHNVGVSVQQTYVVKRVDRDYFNID